MRKCVSAMALWRWRMSDGLSANRKAKDSVFSDLFSDKKYLLQLYQALHPEDIEATEDDLQLITLKSVVAEHIHNDLGFRVGARLMILIEAQSSWSPNIVLRSLGYLIQSYVDFCKEQEISLYDNVAIELPIPELYVIYTGNRKNKPKTLSLSQCFFGGKKSCVEAKVRMIYTGKHGDIIYQYVTFCKVLDQQIKVHGRTRKAIQEAIRICTDKDILKEYLKQRENEIMNIMTALFDQDEVTRSLVASKARVARLEGKREGIKEGIKEGKREGIKEGKQNAQLEAIKSVMDKFHVCLDEALDTLKIPEQDRAFFIKQIEMSDEKL